MVLCDVPFEYSHISNKEGEPDVLRCVEEILEPVRNCCFYLRRHHWQDLAQSRRGKDSWHYWEDWWFQDCTSLPAQPCTLSKRLTQLETTQDSSGQL